MVVGRIAWGGGTDTGRAERTDAEAYQQDHKCVQHRKNGCRHGRRHLLQLFDPSKKTYHAEGSNELHKPIWDADRGAEVKQGHQHNEYVQMIPSAGHEPSEPIRITVYK